MRRFPSPGPTPFDHYVRHIPRHLRIPFPKATDVYPLLFLLMARGMRGGVSLPAKALIVVGVAVNLWGILWTRWGWVGM